MKLELNAKVKGRGTLSTYRKNEAGEIIDKKEVGYIKNLITDTGLQLLVFRPLYAQGVRPSNTYWWYFSIGSGSTEPSHADKKLTFRETEVTNVLSTSSYENLGDNHVTFKNTWNRSFSPKGEAYNVSELGYGSSNNNSLFTRSLIYDNQGEPATISVKAGEYLQLNYTVEVEYDFPKTLAVNFQGHPTISGTKTANMWIRQGGGYSGDYGVLHYSQDASVPDYSSVGYVPPTGTSTPLGICTCTALNGVQKETCICNPSPSDVTFRTLFLEVGTSSRRCWQITFDEDITIPANHEFTFELAIKYESV